MSRRIALAGLLFGGALFVTGCSSISSGTVTGKAHEDAYTYFVNQCYAYDGKTGACTMSVPMPFTEPECWRLDLVQGEDDGSVCVSRQDYDSYGAGDFYPRSAAR